MKIVTRKWRWTAVALWTLAALLALRLGIAWTLVRTNSDPSASLVATPTPFRWPVLSASVWNVFRSGATPEPVAQTGQLSARFRLAGVFLILTDPRDSRAENRCAILDDLQEKRQLLVGEGEGVGPARIVRVAVDHVVLVADDGREEVILLVAGSLGTGGGASGAAPPASESKKILETNRFGNRVGETRWEINKQAIMEYYKEMMDNPERLAGLFMAMDADRSADGKVDGYRLNTARGEKEFYNQIGLRDGDIVRKVNSMRMTSQRRAEYFIGEFVQDRLGAIVMDIERDGVPQKLVYLIQ